MKIKMTTDKSVGIRGGVCFIFGPHFNSFLHNWYVSDKENNESNSKFKSFIRRMKCE